MEERYFQFENKKHNGKNHWKVAYYTDAPVGKTDPNGTIDMNEVMQVSVTSTKKAIVGLVIKTRNRDWLLAFEKGKKLSDVELEVAERKRALWQKCFQLFAVRND